MKITAKNNSVQKPSITTDSKLFSFKLIEHSEEGGLEQTNQGHTSLGTL
jgi:hypothetical protein